MIAVLVLLQVGLSGNWVADLTTQDATDTVDRYLVADGIYACSSCDPPRRYAADGKPHAIPGETETTSEAVSVVGSRVIRTVITSPTRVRETTMTVAKDDASATYVSIDHRSDLPGELRTEYLARRIAPTPAGAHPVSGSWRGVRYVSVPTVLRTITLHENGNQFTYTLPTGVHFTATYGGPFVPVHSPQGVTSMAAVKRIDDQIVLETRQVNGNPVVERTYTLQPDGRSLEIATRNLSTGSTYRAISRRK